MLPLALALAVPVHGPRWQDDLGLLRELGLVPAGTEGVLSMVSTQLLSLLPIGSSGARAGLVGALALAACGGLAFSAWRELLEARRSFVLNAPLALIGSQLWALSPLALAAAAGPGSGAMALCLLLIGVRLLRAGPALPRTLPLLGVVLGLCFGESHLAALALLGIVIVEAWWEGARSELPWGYLAAGFALAAGTCLLVPWLRTWAPNHQLDLGLGPLPGAAESAWLQPVDGGWNAGFEQQLLTQLGDAASLLALAGLGVAVLQRGLRRAWLPWALLTLAGVLAQLGSGDVAAAPAWSGLAASVGAAAFVPLALQIGLCWLWSRPVPFTRFSSVLVLAFAATLVLQRVESFSAQAAPSPSGAELWAEAALERLPARSVVLVESPTLALRLLSAQLLAGARPDVVTVPLSLLQRGTLLTGLLRRAPELAPVLRQVAVQGWADEAALSRLADERPLLVELDPRWNAHLLEHLRPEGLWLAFEPRGPTAIERRDGVEQSRFTLERLREQLEDAGALEPATRAALTASLRQRALLLAALGENEPAASTLRELLELEPAEPLALELMRRLERQQGRVALNSILARPER
ncbi:MAG: hypothetical protein RL685_9 [Pseudomonadota bacterium]